MKIVFDAFWWSEGPVSNRSVMREIIREWISVYPQDEVHLVTTSGAGTAVIDELGLPPERVHTVRIRQHGLAVLLEYPGIVRRIGADQVFTQNFAPPLVRRSSTFVHDLIFATSPGWFTRSERIYFWVLNKSLRNSGQLFTSTRTEAARIERLSGRAGQVQSTGLAISSGLAAAVPKMPALGLREYGFSLIVGRLNERKNLAYGLQVLITSGVATPATPVVVVGEKHGKSLEMPPEVVAMADAGAIRFVGFLEEDELAWLYAKTQLVVFPTLDEGFGLPVIEARYFGAPLALSNIPVLQEVAGDAEASFFSLDNLQEAATTAAAARTRTSPANDGASRTSVLRQYNWPQTVETIRGRMLEHQDSRAENWVTGSRST